MKTHSYLLLAGFIFLLPGFVTFVLPSSAGDSGGILRKTQSPLGEKKLCMFYPNPETTFLQYQLLKVSKCHTSLPVRRAIALARTSIRPGPTRHSSPASEELSCMDSYAVEPHLEADDLAVSPKATPQSKRSTQTKSRPKV